ncbi:MAG: ribosome maturation factor RimP [Actinomycetes bacterium]
MSASEEAVAAGLMEPLAELGVDVEAVTIHKAGRRHVVTIVVDKDGGVDLDLVAGVSQRASAVLDETDLSDHVPGPYVLEVTSPGVDRPLTLARHWRRAAGRLVDATMKDGTLHHGRVREVLTDETVVLDIDGTATTIAIADVTRAVVQVEFTRIDED